jgi:hypothetical protein
MRGILSLSNVLPPSLFSFSLSPCFQVAVLEGEVDRLEKEAVALSDALTLLQAEAAAASGGAAVAGDRCQLAEERAGLQASHAKDAQQQLDAATAALAAAQRAAAHAARGPAPASGAAGSGAAAGGLGAGRVASPAVAALEARVAAAEGARDEAAAERRALEGKVLETNRRLDAALGHLDQLVFDTSLCELVTNGTFLRTARWPGSELGRECVQAVQRAFVST